MPDHPQDPSSSLPPSQQSASMVPPYPSIYSSPYWVEEEKSMLDYLRVLRKHFWKIFLITLVLTGLGAYSSLKMPKKYQAEITITPLASSSGGGISSLMSQVSSIPLLGGQLGNLAGGNNKTAQLVNILKSRTLTQSIAEEFQLIYVLYEKQWNPVQKSWKPDLFGKTPVMEDVVKVLQKKIIKISEDKKTGLVKIQVELKDPELTAKIANRMVLKLQDFVSQNELTVAKRNRIFIEGRLKQNRIDFLEAGKKLNRFYGANQISSTQPQLDVPVGKVEGAGRTFEEFRQELSQLEQKKGELQQKIEEKEVVPNVPSQVYLQYLTIQRELLVKINALLTQQYEMAKIEEGKEDLSFQIIDKAVAPVRPSSPNILLNVGVAFMGSLLFSIFLAFSLEAIRQMKEREKSRP